MITPKDKSMTKTLQQFGVVGAGAWGTALAQSLLRAGRNVLLWGREPEIVAAINTEHHNPVFLPAITLDPVLRATSNLGDLKNSDTLLLVTPSQFLRATCTALKGNIASGIPLIICAKGIEQKTLALMTDVVAAVLPDHPLAILSGPTFAAEVAKGLPTAITLAANDQTLAQNLAQQIGSRTFRPYVGDDVVGAQIGGAVKNVLAIACGIVEGRGLGDNARAAIITRGLSELARLGVACGGRAETFMGLSGLGDLVLTCAGQQSRNMTLGFALGQGRTLAEIMAERQSVAEGVFTAAAATQLAAKHKIDMPITAAIDAILNKGAALDETITALLARPFKNEN
jgi:glycerol-3-phosphate dehydrogenase (NAD(P)+)